jgi:hypothetical protein
MIPGNLVESGKVSYFVLTRISRRSYSDRQSFLRLFGQPLNSTSPYYAGGKNLWDCSSNRQGSAPNQVTQLTIRKQDEAWIRKKRSFTTSRPIRQISFSASHAAMRHRENSPACLPQIPMAIYKCQTLFRRGQAHLHGAVKDHARSSIQQAGHCRRSKNSAYIQNRMPWSPSPQGAERSQ